MFNRLTKYVATRKVVDSTEVTDYEYRAYTGELVFDFDETKPWEI